jgi:hypothetical protein
MFLNIPVHIEQIHIFKASFVAELVVHRDVPSIDTMYQRKQG